MTSHTYSLCYVYELKMREFEFAVAPSNEFLHLKFNYFFFADIFSRWHKNNNFIRGCQRSKHSWRRVNLPCTNRIQCLPTAWLLTVQTSLITELNDYLASNCSYIMSPLWLMDMEQCKHVGLCIFCWDFWSSTHTGQVFVKKGNIRVLPGERRETKRNKNCEQMN